jgi:fatty-acyl-CoA synthase
MFMPLRFATADMTPRPLLIRQILEGALATAAGQEIVYRDHFRQTYAEMGGDVQRLASMLASLGVAEGTTVAFMDWDSHRYLHAYFAIPMMGAVLQTVNVRLSPEQIAFCLNGSGATVLVYHRDFAPQVEAIAPALANITVKIAIADGRNSDPVGNALGYEELLRDAPAEYAFIDFDENALATTFHTTGTTGDPKAVAFSHRQLVLHTVASMAALGHQPIGEGLRRSDVYMPLTPMFHVHAWGVPFVATMLGIKQVYPGRYEPALLVKLAREEHVTFSHCVPTVLQMVLDGAAASGDVNVGPWAMLIGGSPLTGDLQSRATEAGVTTLGGYGMSETAPVIAIARSSPDTVAEGSTRRAGYPIPLVEVAIVDADMIAQPWDGHTGGELVLRSPWLTRSYEGDASASADLWKGGWMHTQDIAAISADGSIAILDRLKDVIKTGGEWVSSAQIEDLLQEHAEVSEAAVIGIPDPKWTERPLAFVVLASGVDTAALQTDLREHLAVLVAGGKISRFAVPEQFIVTHSLPRTSVGKIDKKLLRTQFVDFS